MILDHGVGYEVTTFRTESTYTDFRRPDEVTFVRELQEDLKRRDFTINALALKHDGELVDLFGGQADLHAGVIRAVGQPVERFTEDALRMMRALRFAAQLDFDIEATTYNALKQLAPNLRKISVERVKVELEKLLMSVAAHKGWQQLVQADIIPLLPGNQGAQWYQQAAQIRTDLQRSALPTINSVWAYLCIRLDLTTTEVPRFLKAWKTSREVQQQAQLTSSFLKQTQPNAWDYYQAVKGEQTIIDVLRVLDPERINHVTEGFKKLPIQDKSQLAITGQQLIQQGILPPGPQLGQLLFWLEQQVVAKHLENDEKLLLNAAKNWQEKG
jgi:tRNA nucleotidyltransferase (CCA-adding enzyme)